MMDDLERTLIDAERVAPAADLRARVLGSAMPLVRPDDSRLDHLWFSPGWRTTAALALLALAAVERFSPQITAWAPVVEVHRSNSSVQTVAAAARQAGLSPDETATIVAQAIEVERARANQ